MGGNMGFHDLPQNGRFRRPLAAAVVQPMFRLETLAALV